MPPALLAALLTRVKRAVKPRGAKVALARDLGVPKQRVTQWLKEHNAPTAEDALRLLEWVTAAEAQQKKTPPMLLTSTGRKTRKSKVTTNEKAKSDRRKR